MQNYTLVFLHGKYGGSSKPVLLYFFEFFDVSLFWEAIFLYADSTKCTGISLAFCWTGRIYDFRVTFNFIPLKVLLSWKCLHSFYRVDFSSRAPIPLLFPLLPSEWSIVRTSESGMKLNGVTVWNMPAFLKSQSFSGLHSFFERSSVVSFCFCFVQKNGCGHNKYF